LAAAGCISVRIQRERFRELLARFKHDAVHKSIEELHSVLCAIPFEPYAPIRDQLQIILRAANRERKTAGLELLPWNTVQLRRKPVRVFI